MITPKQAPEPIDEARDTITTSKDDSNRNRKSGQASAKHRPSILRGPPRRRNGRRPMHDIGRGAFSKNGSHATANAKRRPIGARESKCDGRRETFHLATPNAEAAAILALRIYRTVKGAGWNAALSKHKPDAAPMQPKPAPLGDAVFHGIAARSRS